MANFSLYQDLYKTIEEQNLCVNHPSLGKIKLELSPEQRNMAIEAGSKNFSYMNLPRQCGVTTFISLLAYHFALKTDCSIVIMSYNNVNLRQISDNIDKFARKEYTNWVRYLGGSRIHYITDISTLKSLGKIDYFLVDNADYINIDIKNCRSFDDSTFMFAVSTYDHDGPNLNSDMRKLFELTEASNNPMSFEDRLVSFLNNGKHIQPDRWSNDPIKFTHYFYKNSRGGLTLEEGNNITEYLGDLSMQTKKRIEEYGNQWVVL